MIRTSPFVVLTILLGLCSSCLAQRDADDAGDRLLLSVRRPAIVNSTFESLSVGFYTGPNLLPVDYEVKCVAPGSDCQAESLVEPVGGRLPSKVAYITATLFPLESNTTYWCYALSSSDKVTKCQGPLVGTTALPEGALVSYTLQYQQMSSFFDLEKREQVCINLLELAPNGTCAIQDVLDGATRAVNTSLVFGIVDYNEYSEGLLLFDQLSDPTNDTLDVLANGIVNGSSRVDVVDVSIDYVPKFDSPGAPGFVRAPTVGVMNATVTWLDGRVGIPVEDYAVNCVVSSASALCTDAGVNVTGLPRRSESAFVTGLAPNTTYECWAVASNIAGSVCSKEPVAFRTLIEPGPPTNLQENAVSNTSVTIGWMDGLEGNPIETYDVNCVNGTSTSCLSAGVSSLDIPRGSEQGRVSSMIPNTTYECWIIAKNEVGNACSSSPVEIKTWIEAGQPTSLTEQAITNSTVTIGWVDGDGGNPEERYSVNCVTGSSPCTSSGTSVSNVTRGVQSATVTGLAFNSSYMCYVLAINAVDTICSSPLSITTTIKPGPPTNVQNPEISTSWAAVTWDDGALGNPQENYTVNCLDSSGSTKCTDSGIQVTDISRGTEFANVTGLDPNTTYSCWVIAENIVGNVCSPLPVTNRTWIQAGEPTSFVQGQIGSTSVEFSWVDGLEGYPSETYSITCTTNTAATDCTNPGGTVVEESGIDAGVENGVVTGLSAGTSYKCWAKAVNGAGEVCSDSITLSTTSQLNTKAVIASNQSVSITPDTFAPPSGGSNVTYRVQCLNSSATVCDPQATGTGALQPATPLTDPAAINVAGLTNDVSYQCFSVMSYADTSSTLKYACGGPIEVKPFAKPVVDKVIAGDQKLTISPIAYTAPSGGSDVKYQVQCLNSTATTCDPLATGIGALQPTSAQSFVSGIPVSDLTNDIPYTCFVVVTYTLNSETKYTCSGGAAAAPTASVPTLVPGQVIAGTKKITITPDVFTSPAGTSNVTYQVQCFEVTTNACNLNSALSPSVPLTSPAPIVLTNLKDRSTYSCFSVVSYVLNSSLIYGCSDVYNAVPNTEPQVLTASDVSPASATSADIQVATYTSFAAASNIQYQTQCLPSSATVCNPTVTSGTGAVQPSTASSTSGTFTVPGLTNGTTYQCFSVISYTYSIDSQLKYTCSAPYEYTFTEPLCTWKSQTSPADNNWSSVTWGGPAGSELFVAVASTGTGNRVMTSPDGITWTIQTSAADNVWSSVTWGGPTGSELFVAVANSGTGNRVMTSPDGINWTIQTSAADNVWNSVTWGGPTGNELFVAVARTGTGNRVMTSPDGINWTIQNSAADNKWTSVTWGGPSGNELFVAVAFSGVGNRVMTSPDGITWTIQNSPADNNWISVTWGGPTGNELFVAVALTGIGNRVMTSPDGINWTIQNSAADNGWYSVTWGGPTGSGLFVAVAYSGVGNRVMTSPDGINWSIQNSAADNGWLSVTWGGPTGNGSLWQWLFQAWATGS